MKILENKGVVSYDSKENAYTFTTDVDTIKKNLANLKEKEELMNKKDEYISPLLKLKKEEKRYK